MTRKLVWVMAVTVIGMIWLDLKNSLKSRRHHVETTKELARWEGEGGNVKGVCLLIVNRKVDAKRRSFAWGSL